MNSAMSITKEKEIIWEENDSTPPPKKYTSPSTSDVCDIITATSGSNESVPLTAITKISGIYKIINKVNGKYYVGSSRNLKRRWESHRYQLDRNIHSNAHLQASWNKHGKENFSFETILRVDPIHLLNTEQSYLDNALLDRDKCYNMTYIAGGGWDFPPEIMKKIRMNRKYYRGAENQRYGTHLSETTRQKISRRLTGKKLSSKTKLKMSNSKLGVKRSVEFCIKNKLNKMGDKNHNYNTTSYKFFNKNNGESYHGTMCGLYSKYKLDQANVYKLVQRKNVKSVKGWIIT
jgi:group I intron endonuclease